MDPALPRCLDHVSLHDIASVADSIVTKHANNVQVDTDECVDTCIKGLVET